MVRLRCPQAGDLENRMAEWEDMAGQYLRSDAMRDLFLLFGHEPDMSLPLHHLVAKEQGFSHMHWDYRRRLASGERWLLDDGDPVAEQHADAIGEIAEALGMRDRGIPPQVGIPYGCEWVLCLGGARNANLERAMTAMSIRSRLRDAGRDVPIMGLTGNRPLSPVEMPDAMRVIADATPGTTMESDVMLAALHAVGAGQGMANAGIPSPRAVTAEDMASETEVEQGNGWQVRRWDSESVIVADSRDGRARANTVDTMIAFVEATGVSPGDSLAIVTSPIYVPYQTAALVPLALAHGFSFDMFGSVPIAGATQSDGGMATKYLQEANGTIDAIAGSLGI